MFVKPSAKSKSQDISRQPAVFIIGEARSGTSILNRCLQQHALFRVDSTETGEDPTEADVFSKPLTVLRAAVYGEHNNANAYILNDSARLAALKKRLRCLPMIRPLDAAVKRHWRISSIVHRKRTLQFLGIHHLLRLYFEESRVARHQKIILDKSPSSINHVSLISTVFPKAKLIYIYRHPVATLASYRKRGQRKLAAGSDPSLSEWCKITVEELAARIARHIETACTAEKKYGVPVCMVRYESLTNTPGAALDAVADFLGIDGAASLVPSQKNSQWSEDPALYQAISAPINDWQDFVSRDEADSLQQLLADEMEMFGYKTV